LKILVAAANVENVVSPSAVARGQQYDSAATKDNSV